MNRNEQPGNLDRILLEEDLLVPSSGFAESVMAAIQERAAEPAPIPFPWKLALPGIAGFLMGIAVIVRFAVGVVSSLNQNKGAADFLPIERFNLVWSPSIRAAAVPALLALLASAACVLLCRRLAGGWSSQ